MAAIGGPPWHGHAEHVRPVTYRVVRRYFDETHPDHGKEIRSGLSLEEAQAWCSDPSTAAAPDADGTVAWFDGYDRERGTS